MNHSRKIGVKRDETSEILDCSSTHVLEVKCHLTQGRLPRIKKEVFRILLETTKRRRRKFLKCRTGCALV